MGTVQHHVVVATTWDDKEANRIRFWIGEDGVSRRQLFTFADSPLNGFTTIVMNPDGSNDGREDSDEGDNVRDRFIAELRRTEVIDDGTVSSRWDWVEITYGELGAATERTNCVNVVDGQQDASDGTDTALRYVADALSHEDRDIVLKFATFLRDLKGG